MGELENDVDTCTLKDELQVAIVVVPIAQVAREPFEQVSQLERLTR